MHPSPLAIEKDTAIPGADPEIFAPIGARSRAQSVDALEGECFGRELGMPATDTGLFLADETFVRTHPKLAAEAHHAPDLGIRDPFLASQKEPMVPLLQVEA
jgi:hypothetical protein